MEIPRYNEFYPYILKVMKDNKARSRKEIRKELLANMNITEEKLKEKLKSGISKFASSSGWGITYLYQAEILKKVKRGIYQLSDIGRKYIDEKGFYISEEDLMKSEKYRKFVNRDKSSKEKIKKDNHHLNEKLNKTPQEEIENAFEIINNQLKDDLLSEIEEMEPIDFEKLILDLLIKMGYGGKDKENIITTPKSHDEGVDGLIKQDPLGLDSIYIQAKRWKNTIGRETIQSFVGALSGFGASKGVFITTSDFSVPAKDYAKKHLHSKIILINGNKLVEYMIIYGLGVSVDQVYEIKKIDKDYFSSDF